MSNHSSQSGSTLSGILLVAGTCIGAGMLALPLVPGMDGFGPALFTNALCWLFVLCTGLLLLEVTLWMDEGAHLLSMAKRFLGPIGKILGGSAFLFLYYCLMVAYLAGGSPLWGIVIEQATGWSMPPWISFASFTTLFAFILFLGTRSIDRINWLLMAGLILAYVMLIGVGTTSIESDLLLGRGHWFLGAAALPTFFSAYGYHNIIPSITTYLKGNVRKLRLAIIIGSTLPFITYGLWLALVIGTVSSDQLEAAYTIGQPVSHLLQNVTGNAWIGQLSLFFSFFALATSLLGVSMSMVDFLGDGIGIVRREGLVRLGLVFLVFAPPSVLALNNPRIFFDALTYAGAFGEAVLNGILPVAMVWVGRYRMGLHSAFKLPGGKPMLLLLALFAVGVVGLEICSLIS